MHAISETKRFRKTLQAETSSEERKKRNLLLRRAQQIASVERTTVEMP
jgi:hypothetical protein